MSVTPIQATPARQYKGMRYVPIFDGAWDSTKDYEPLTIVSYQGNSYTSRTFVPANTAITNETYWALTGNYNAQVEAYRQEVQKLEGDIFSTILTPQMFGGVGDGVHNDTNAFNLLANETGNKFIPNGTYILNEPVELSNVLYDNGTYSSYKPEYEKPLILDLKGLSNIKGKIALPDTDMYEEDACIINNKLYVITNEYSDGNNGIAVYDASYTLIDHVSSDKTTVGTCNNCCTDGTYLYIDYDNGYHAKFSPADLSTPILLVDTNYRNTCYDNETLYAVTINANSVEISKLDSTLSVLSDTKIINNVTRQTLQSSTIYNGQLYIPTTQGTFYAIDLVSGKVLGVDYQDAPFEIEGLFEKDEKLVAIGHNATVGGVFSIQGFNNGNSFHNMRYIEVDCNSEYFSPTFIDPNSRTSIYHVINGLTAGVMPANECDVLWLGHNLICLSRGINAIHYWNGSIWKYLRGFYTDAISIDDNDKILLKVGSNGSMYIIFTGYTMTESSTVIYKDMSAIFEKLGYSASTEFTFDTLAMTGGVIPLSSDVYAVHLLLKNDRLGIWVKPLLGVDQTINCTIKNTVFVYD